MPLVSQRPCTDPLNWNLYADFSGEMYIPFHDYVQPEQTCQVDVPFPQFLRLPRELQLRILRSCSSATLFQLMHVSSATRDEARKLFWSDPGARYVVDGAWLQAGGFSGHTVDDVAALALMKHVEVDFGTGGPFVRRAWDDGEPQYGRRPSPADAAERMADAFWQTLQRCLPCATNVVLKDSELGHTKEGDAAPAVLTLLAERCPAGIRASASCLQVVAGCSYLMRESLWQPVWHGRSQPATWNRVDSFDDTTQSVLPPAKTFRGPVGAFCRIDYNVRRLSYLYGARRLLLIQAMEAYYTQNPQTPFVCPVPECDFRFETPRAWAVHATDELHDVMDFKLPTETLEMLFSEHDARLARMEQDIADTIIRLRLEWGEEGSEQRRKREEEFLHQLQHDPAYAQAKPPRECAVWHRYLIEMNNEKTAYSEQ
ncbi:uncharacterized protein EI97DRAFT_414808 [Westerdykella ornata]|uniref:Uncharacterized protein n=1 Tax=Westerdykella ornata TaxID=318751 RepID=A0A6A6JNX2_WESOR|nr:uncharacterized protein EI97DRAFT_414808 [Westerdykella ornata]KAF2278350.1 hypothetical protein EI97DRAFT_414808 [Westerdykella ornata]